MAVALGQAAMAPLVVLAVLAAEAKQDLAGVCPIILVVLSRRREKEVLVVLAARAGTYGNKRTGVLVVVVVVLEPLVLVERLVRMQ